MLLSHNDRLVSFVAEWKPERRLETTARLNPKGDGNAVWGFLTMTQLGLAIALVLFTSLTPISAQQSSASDLLQAITTRLTVTNTVTQQEFLCHGFVDVTRYDIAYVVTAKHCLQEPAQETLSAPPSPGGSIPISVSIQYSNGETGTGRRFVFAWGGSDGPAVVGGTFEQRPPSLNSLCPNCRAYRSFGANQRMQVVSMLSAGAGPAIPSTGTLLVDQYGRYLLALPAAHGTSGSAVLDARNGYLVGIVLSGSLLPSTEAGWNTRVAPGGVVFDSVRRAVDLWEAQSPATSPPNSGPPLPPCDGTSVTTDPSWRGLTCQ